ncbi:MAG: hypothetical protein L6R38_002247 [Xanthoria sp. 2 TBL-2021]|nr:MAG: hypothetical protein L6R38_002247 [Xanthoria sp. 2 TBL-2021]
MGLLDELQRLNTTEKGTQFIDPKGQPFAPFPVQEGHASPTSEFEIFRGDLARILYEWARDLSNVDFQVGTTIQEVIFNNNNNDNVKVRLSDGKVHEYDLLVAADGQWSKWNIYHALKSRVICLRPDPDGTIRAAFICMPLNSAQNAAWLAASSSKHDRQTQVELRRTQFGDSGWEAQRILASMGNGPDFISTTSNRTRCSDGLKTA